MAAISGKKRKTERERYVRLDQDSIEEILVRLPCKSLIRFGSACKLFGSFAQDPQFIQEHRERNMKPSHYLNWDREDKTKLHVFRLGHDNYSHVKCIETNRYRLATPSSYGLVCLHGWDSKSVALFNPATENIMALPDLPSLYAYQTNNPPGYPIPTTWRYNCLGFGFDLKILRYKVVMLVMADETVSECYVLTVNDDSSWRRIEVSINSTFHFRPKPIYADGVLYWENSPVETLVKIFVFDLSTEKMDVIDSPAKFTDDRYGFGKHLTSLQGKLCSVQLTPPTFDAPLTMTIWRLLNASSVDWVLWYKIEISNSVSSSLNFWSLHPVCIDGSGRIICEGLGNLYRYNIHDKSLEIYPVSQKVEGVAYYIHPYGISWLSPFSQLLIMLGQYKG